MDNRHIIEFCCSITPKELLRGSQIGIPDANYWIEDDKYPSSVTISLPGNEPHMIDLDWGNITFGKKAYFLCTCGRRASKLYLPSGEYEFKCRKCHKLKYQLATFNRYSVAGKKLYKANRFQKLSDSRANMGRILYRGEFTKKFERFLGLCEKAGFENIVHGAHDLKALIKL